MHITYHYYEARLHHGTYAPSEGLTVAIGGKWSLAGICSSLGLDEIPQYRLMVYKEIVILHL